MKLLCALLRGWLVRKDELIGWQNMSVVKKAG